MDRPLALSAEDLAYLICPGIGWLLVAADVVGRCNDLMAKADCGPDRTGIDGDKISEEMKVTRHMSDQNYAEESRQLLQRFQEGDQQAAEIIFHRYLQRLIKLAAFQLSEKLQRRVAPEDVVQSVFRSFFGKAQEGRFFLERSGDLWRLLASITKHKLLKKAEHHRQQKRSLNREELLADGSPAELFAVEPTEVEGLALADEIQLLMGQLDPLQCTMLELRLQGQAIPDIAKTVERSERTVRRFLGGMRDRLEERLRDLGN